VAAPRTVTGLLVVSVCYLAVLSFLNARGVRASSLSVAGVEALIYLVCLALLMRRLPPVAVAISLFIFSWVVLSWLLRQSTDVKSLRDLVIPILFLSLGRQVADVAFAERALRLILVIMVALGLFETLFTSLYSTLFNTYSFYINMGGIRDGSAAFDGQMLTLNGYRPEGIGRTILPGLLGSHRTSSALMEPVSLGNFSAILMAWGLSKPWNERRDAATFVLGAVLLITLSDSRFGMLVCAAMVALRLLPLPMVRRCAPAIPFVILACVLGVAALVPGTSDDLLGRISRSGRALLQFDVPLLLGVYSPLPNFGDMGFAYVVSRFGAPLTIGLILALFLVPMADERGQRFRVLVVTYMFANFAVSGTSVFALKTAGLLWFLFGVLSAATPSPDVKASAPPTPPPPSAPLPWALP
jgi:putative polymerase